jgi:hypothetical protein
MVVNFDWSKYKCIVPECTKGKIKIVKELSKDGISTVLYEKDKHPHTLHPCMSDRKSDVATYEIFTIEATGHILLTGLGLGIILLIARDMPQIKSITVLEKNQDVIDLISPHFPDVKIIQGDAWEYTPDKKYDYIWHDFDEGILELPGMFRIMKRYEPYAKKQNCWLMNFRLAKADHMNTDNYLPEPKIKVYKYNKM